MNPLAAVILLVAGAGLVPGLTGCQKQDEPLPPPATVSQAKPRTEAAILNGRWQRPDGGYILALKNVTGSGAIEAAYFNPQPIHVAKAEVTQSNGQCEVFVELRDVNYPGSTYKLTYDPSDDRLIGEYYQAVAKETYPIFFVRLKP